jgi:hypothetical protein
VPPDQHEALDVLLRQQWLMLPEVLVTYPAQIHPSWLEEASLARYQKLPFELFV